MPNQRPRSNQLEQNLFSSRSFTRVTSSETPGQSFGSAETGVTKAYLFCRPDWLPSGSTKMPALLTGQANVQFDVSHVCQMEQTDPNSAFLICNYLCSVESQRSHLKALFTRIRTVLNPCILLPGFVWTGLNKPLDLESGCKKIVFGEQIQRAYLWKKKIAVSKMSGFVWTGNNSIPEYFSISISIFNILRHLNRLLIRFQ